MLDITQMLDISWFLLLIGGFVFVCYMVYEWLMG